MFFEQVAAWFIVSFAVDVFYRIQLNLYSLAHTLVKNQKFANRNLDHELNCNQKNQIVWKHRPNWLFYALMLRTKLYQNPSFFTGHQNLNKPNSSAARTVYGLRFLTFYKFIVSFFFLCQDANKTRSNCAMIGYNLPKRHKLTLYKTQNGESKYVDHKYFFNFYQELPICAKPCGQTFKYYRAGKFFGPCIV